ncbi:MAG: hypothetical protein HY337_09070 [Gemmatimonadetes bacterium]|nr:hypothetical protein [Gemmatimonadota bacterium]
MIHHVLPAPAVVRAAVLVAALAGAPALGAQEFVPPQGEESSSFARFGVFGFASRAGIDFTTGTHAVLSIALDAGDVYSNRLRFRPSFEVGLGDTTTYIGNAEVLFRFTGDAEAAVPYIGGGLAVWGRQQCNRLPGCPGIWAQAVIGFELRLRGHINWQVEYHAEDAFDRHRFFIGLTTRRGS